MKKKLIKGSARGITFSDRELFPIYSKIKYTIDKKNKRLLIALSEKDNGETINWKERLELIAAEEEYLSHVRDASISRKSTGNNEFIPLVDIRSKEVLQLFAGYDQLHVTIGEDLVIVTCENNGESILERVRGLLQRKKNRRTFVFQKKEIFRAAGTSVAESPETQILKVASCFSGAGLMDQGFLEAGGYDLIFALEKNPEAVRTYRYNLGDHIYEDDICMLDTSLINDPDIMIGGPPCVGFSSSNRRTNFLDNPNNLLVHKYIETIRALKGLKVFVLENVPQIITSFGGVYAKEICASLSDFDISYGVLSSADYGAPQVRNRAIFIGSKIGPIPLPPPTHDENQYVTVRQAFEGLHDDIPNQMDITIPRPETFERMQYIEPGENWESIPQQLRGNMRKGKTHSSIFKRLLWDKPSISITNFRKSNILHPSLNRILSVREVARLFGLPDHFVFKGSLVAMQQQCANGVPVQMAKAIANQIKLAFKRYSTYGLS